MRSRSLLAVAAATLALTGAWPTTAEAAKPAPPAKQAQPAKAAPAADPSPAELARTIKAFTDAAGRSMGPRSGDLFALPAKYRYVIDPTMLDPVTAHFEVDGATKPMEVLGNHHGTLWDYDTRIPLLLWGPGRVKAGWTSREAATQQDIVPTIAHVLGAVPPEDAAGRALTGPLLPAARPPKVVLVLVFDQGGRSMMAAHPNATPFIDTLRREGAWFDEARVTHLDPETIVGHVAIGTGAYPARHGVTANKPWIGAAGLSRMAVLDAEGPTPAAIESATFGDVWLRQTKGKALVIGQSLADRAAIGMAGHGALYAGNPKPIVQWFDAKKGGWTTNARAFAQPSYMAQLRPEGYWRELGGPEARWRGHPIGSTEDFKMSPAAAKYDGDAMAALLEREPVGQDDTPDVVFWSLKAGDYTSHRYGLESLEVRDVLAAEDAQAKRIVEQLAKKVGREHLMVAFTADHGGGLLPELHGGARLSEDAVVAMINERFDKRANGVPLALSTTSTQIYLDDAELRANGVTAVQVRDFLKAFKPDGKPFYAAVFTRAEIEALNRK